MPSAGLLVFLVVTIALATLVMIALIAVVRRRLRAVPWTDEPEDRPWREEALVPVGPRRPRSSAAVALPLPEPEVEATEAYGSELPEHDADADALAG